MHLLLEAMHLLLLASIETRSDTEKQRNLDLRLPAVQQLQLRLLGHCVLQAAFVQLDMMHVFSTVAKERTKERQFKHRKV